MRKYLAIDAAHLKGKYKGYLYLVTAIDANDQLYLAAWGMSNKAESSTEWGAVLGRLKGALQRWGLEDLEGYSIVSDRAKGLIRAVQATFPAAHHAFCCQHLLLSNWHQAGFNHPELTNLFWRAAAASTEAEYEGYLQKMRRINDKAPDYFTGLAHPKYWSDWAFPGKRWGKRTSNLVESANGLFREARSLPHMALLEHIRGWMTDKISKTAESINFAPGLRHQLAPLARKALEQLRPAAERQMVRVVTPSDFEVKSPGRDWQDVDLNSRTCSCGKYQELGWPCVHAYGAIMRIRRDPGEYTDPLLTLQALADTYKLPLHGPGPEECWGFPLIQVWTRRYYALLAAVQRLERGIGEVQTLPRLCGAVYAAALAIIADSTPVAHLLGTLV